MTENEVSGQIVDAAIKVHTVLGPGLLESVYEAALAYELEKRGFKVLRQHPVPVIFEEVHLECGFRADLLVQDLVVVELKAVEQVHPVHKKQLLTHLRLTGKRVGLLINFNVELLKDGITRVVNNFRE